MDGTYLYGGCLFAHFGHFIWESLPRIAAIRKCPEYPLLFISPYDRIFETQRLFFKTLGIKNEIKLIKNPVRVSRLIYSPAEASLVPLSMTEDTLAALACKNFAPVMDKKIWLSRSKLKYGLILNERLIEEQIASLGFEIVYPEKTPLLEQIKLISSSRIVAGFSGSQFFSAFFARKILGTIIIFNRRLGVPDTIPFLLRSKNMAGILPMFKVREAEKGAKEGNMIALEPDRIIRTLAENV
ncbi:MAG: glycosyltransferase family 61 protein [Desulfovibrio sp.]|nr:glycosyltransferase family 61 protein [Desulfovibrio sp.]